MDIGVVAALGVAVGAMTTAAGIFLGVFKGMPVWKFPLVILGLMLIISTPSMVIAWLKLRQRNLGPILDANGWAVNTRAKVNVPFGAALTSVAALPPGSERTLTDPYADKRQPWGLYVSLTILILGALWYFGKVDRVLPTKLQSTSVLGTNAWASRSTDTNTVPAPAP